MISVCMATYNGASTIKRQLLSIINQLDKTDEIVIVDDRSSDETVKILKHLFVEFPIKHTIIINENNIGPIGSFECAMKSAIGDYIYLSDQDDEWFTNKVITCQRIFKEQRAQLIVHDAHVVDGDMQLLDPSWNHYNSNRVEQGILGNLVKNGYTGAMMAFTKELRDLCLPFPGNIPMHDQWIFIVAKHYHKKIVHIKTSLMNYVRHGSNVTGHQRSVYKIIEDRLYLISCYFQLVHRKM